jgi:hypothetical protein
MIIFHGDNQILSRSTFLDLKHRELASGKQIVELSGLGLTLQELKNKSTSSSLLGDTNSLFIDDLFGSRAAREKNLIIDYLLAHGNADINIWESKDVSLQLKKFPPDLIRKFDLPKKVFQFLDNPSLPLLQQSLQNTSPEQIFALLVGHFRKLLIVKSHAGNFPAWQEQKLTSQASRYTAEKLIELYQELLQIDYRQKSSLSAFDLPFSLELWLARL